MFDASMTEMMVVAVIALLVIGPERLPEVATKVGGWIGKAKAFISTTKADIEREFQASEMKNLLSEQQQEIEELRKMVSSTQDDLKSNFDDAKDVFENKIHSSVDDVKSLDQNDEKATTPKSEAKKNDG
ncbi:MAG: twin-arginine translocase subunit TatB [Aquificaceae bacterium]|nr:MAG: twin-arginine translocase subunit TatB [Aquificaceae bacterium]